MQWIQKQRHRQLTSRRYSFFVLNQFVVVSLFSVVWGYVTTIINGTKFMDINFATNLEVQLSQMAPYWVSYMLQRNLGSATDLAQLLRLSWGSFQRHFMSPTVSSSSSSLPHFPGWLATDM